MQLMPQTSEEVGERLKIDDMAHPVSNVRGGVYYLRKLYDMFEGASDLDRVRLALAAYNAGPGRVYDAQGIAAYLDDDPREWDAVKQALPLLSKRYYTLHQDVWPQGKPPVAGWFGGSQETVVYVEKVMDYYERYKGAME
jgi:membrane-bound lytic murein transglycosylase F